MDDGQGKIIKTVSETDVRNLLLFGSSGTGKTLLLCEALKIKICKLKRREMKIKVFVTTFEWMAELILQKIKDEYLNTLAEEISFIGLRELCKTLDVEYDSFKAQATLNHVIPALSAQHEDAQVLLLCDELWCCSSRAEPIWSEIATPDNVHWFIALNPSTDPIAKYGKQVEISLPTCEDVHCFQLLEKHRNSLPIKELYEYAVKHEPTGYISLDKDLEVAPALLPDGHLPVWVECPSNARYVAALEFVATLPQLQLYTSLTVIRGLYTDADAVRALCETRGWRCYEDNKIYGIEDQVCVLLDCGDLRPELLSRAVNLLVIVTTQNR